MSERLVSCQSYSLYESMRGDSQEQRRSDGQVSNSGELVSCSKSISCCIFVAISYSVGLLPDSNALMFLVHKVLHGTGSSNRRKANVSGKLPCSNCLAVPPVTKPQLVF